MNSQLNKTHRTRGKNHWNRGADIVENINDYLNLKEYKEGFAHQELVRVSI